MSNSSAIMHLFKISGPSRTFGLGYLGSGLGLIIHHFKLFRLTFNGKNFQDTLKGMICTKTNISNIIIDRSTQIHFLHKPILMISIGAALMLGFTCFYFISALKQRLCFWLRQEPKESRCCLSVRASGILCLRKL